MKPELRKNFRRARQGLSPEERDRRSRAAVENAAALPFYRRCASMHGYLPLPEELQTRLFLRGALEGGKQVSVPWIDPRSGRLSACELSSLDEAMHRDTLGIEAPRHCRLVAPESIDVAFVPGIAFDAEGGRLGFGKGYYDTFLRTMPAVKVGLAFEAQISGDALPMGGDDVFMDFVVTENGVRARGNPPEFFLLPSERRELLCAARQAVLETLGKIKIMPPPAVPDWGPLALEAGVFISLHARGELRGCIGMLRPGEALGAAVSRAAAMAATQDPRFAPVDSGELEDLDIEVSVLSEPRPAEARNVRVGRHGLVVSLGDRRGLLLPQVAVEHAMGREEFLSACCRKAGLPAGAWREGAGIEIFTAQVFNEAA